MAGSVFQEKGNYLMSQKQVNKPTETKEAPAKTEAKDLEPKGNEIKAKADEIADMIDDVLEKNAEEFVKSYVQRGGE